MLIYLQNNHEIYIIFYYFSKNEEKIWECFKTTAVIRLGNEIY